MVLPWIFAIWINDVRALLFSLVWQIVLMAQWLLLGKCILSPIENNGSRHPAVLEGAANMMGIPIKDFNAGWLLINTVSPAFYMAARLSRVLGI
jgi:hypothetical protein